MGDFVTIEDVATALRETVDNATADQAITAAESAVRGFCGWNLSQETVTSEPVEPVGGLIFLPTLHLTSLTIVENGISLTAGTGSFTWSRNGIVRRYGTGGMWNGCWSQQWQAVVATYTHGYALGSSQLIPAKTSALSYAIRQYQNAAQMRSESVGAVSDVYAIPATGVPIGVDLSYSEQNLLGPLRLPVLA